MTQVLGLRKERLKDYHIGMVLRSGLLATALGLCSTALGALGGNPFPMAVHVIFALVYFALFSGTRLALLQVLLSIYRRSRAVTRVAIYGAGRTGMALASGVWLGGLLLGGAGAATQPAAMVRVFDPVPPGGLCAAAELCRLTKGMP